MYFGEYQSGVAPSNKLPYWFLGAISLVTVVAAVLIWTCHANVEPGSRDCQLCDDRHLALILQSADSLVIPPLFYFNNILSSSEGTPGVQKEKRGFDHRTPPQSEREARFHQPLKAMDLSDSWAHSSPMKGAPQKGK